MLGVALLLLSAIGDLPKSEQAKVDALRASGADVWIERPGAGVVEVGIDFKKVIADRRLKEVSGLESLTVLRVLEGNITDTGLSYLVLVPKLRLLVLKGRGITDQGCRYLASHRNLKKLDLMGAKLTEAGVNQLVRLGRLEELYLHGARLDDSALRVLPRMSWLKKLSLPKATAADKVASIRRAMPKTQVSTY